MAARKRNTLGIYVYEMRNLDGFHVMTPVNGPMPSSKEAAEWIEDKCKGCEATYAIVEVKRVVDVRTVTKVSAIDVNKDAFVTAFANDADRIRDRSLEGDEVGEQEVDSGGAGGADTGGAPHASLPGRPQG